MAKTNPARARTSRTSDEAGESTRASSTRRARKAAAARPAKLPRAVSGVVQVAHDKKAADVVVLDLRKAGGFTDYFVICTAMNARQISAIADAVRDTLKKEYGERPALAEGVEKSEWILLDYFCGLLVVCHLHDARDGPRQLRRSRRGGLSSSPRRRGPR